MLGRTAASLFWMSRYMERAENIARLIEVGYRVSMVPDVGTGHREDWRSTLIASGCMPAYQARHGAISTKAVVDFLLFDRAHPSSVVSCMESARNNGRSVRTGLTREMWEALNTTWNEFSAIEPGKLSPGKLPELLDWVRQRAGLYRGAMIGTLLRDEGYHFSQLGTFVERGDNTARILDSKYTVLLPSNNAVGGDRNQHQLETILRSVGAHQSYRYFYKDSYRPLNVADFMIMRPEMPRSLRFCSNWVDGSVQALARMTEGGAHSLETSATSHQSIVDAAVDEIFRGGLHGFLIDFLAQNASLSDAIAEDYNFV
jgi:uncharacterized alpha-E superfamily protein